MNNNQKENITAKYNIKITKEDNYKTNKTLIYNNLNKNGNKEKLIIKVKKDEEEEENKEENKIKEQEIIKNKINKKNILSVDVTKPNKESLSYEIKKKEIENKKEIEINNKKKNIEKLKLKNKELQEQYNKLLTELKNEENNMHEDLIKYNKKIKELDKDFKNKVLTKKNIIKDISNLNLQLNLECNKLLEYNNLIKINNKNKNIFINVPKNGDINERIEKIIQLKEHQNSNCMKKFLLLKKEIFYYNEKINSNTNIDKNIKKENPLIIKKEEELQYILDKLNNEIEEIKREIAYLKNIQYKHDIICKKTKENLLKELEYTKMDKFKKLEQNELIQNIKQIHEIKRQKIIYRNKNNSLNLSSFKITKNNNNSNFIHNIIKIRKNNSVRNISIDNNDNTIINNSELINIKKNENISLVVSPHSLSSNETMCKTHRNNQNINSDNDKVNKILFPELNISNNIFEYVKKRIKKNNLKNYKSNSMGKIKENYSFGIISKSLFTEEEKSIFKNYNFIPEENIDNLELKYKNKIEKIKNLKQKIKNNNKINNEQKIKFDFLLESNNKKNENIEMKNRKLSHIIKINDYKILKLKTIIKQKIKEEEKFDMNIKHKEYININLRGHIKIYNDIQNTPLK